MNELSPWRIRRLARAEDVQAEHPYASEEEISLSAYWNILVKHRNIILSIFLVVFGAGSYFALSATTLYTAAATVKIEPQNPRVTGLGELQPLGLRSDDDYQATQLALLRTRPVAARVITELGLESNKAFTDARIVSPNPVDHVKSWITGPLQFIFDYLKPLFQSRPERHESQAVGSLVNVVKGGGLELTVAPWLIDRYLGFINVNSIRGTRLVRVEFTTPDPTLSQALANAHVQTFMRTSLESRFSLTQEAREFLDQKKDELSQKLKRSEAEMNRFRREHGVLSVEKGENIVVDRLVDVNKQLTGARAQRIEAESLYRTVENRNYQDLAEIMKHGLVQQLKSNIANLEADKARTATIFKPDHPKIQELNQQLSAARQAFSNEVANVVRGIKSNYAAALAKERALEGEAQRQQEDALRLRELGVQYTLLQEEVNANRSLYESVLKRLSETNVSNDLAVSNMQIAERAAKPLGPSGPNVPLYLLASMVSGLLLGVGVGFLREFVDSTVGTPEDVWRSVGLGTFGVVPHIKSLNRAPYKERLIEGLKQSAQSPVSGIPAQELITHHGPHSIMTEAYRAIRTSLLLSQADKPPQVILLTSPLPGEGKTVTSLNLGIALARDGHTVLLVDADLRKGCCHNRLGLTNNRGLSNVLAGRLSLDEGIQETPVSGLSLLSRGIPPPNPSELLGSRKMKEILKELRERFEFILIDSCPVIAISDAAILSVISDGVLLVFDGQRTSTACAQKAVERLDTVRARFLGVILNAVNLDDPDYSYYRTYSQYYHQDSNGNEELSERSANGFHPSDQMSGESAKPSVEENCANPFGKETTEWVASNSAHGTQTTDSDSGPLHEGKPDGITPQAFMNRLMDVFMESVGPVAPLIVRHHIGILGESKDAFPKSRIDQLMKSLAPEIVDTEMRLRFQKKIAEEIRNLENQ